MSGNTASNGGGIWNYGSLKINNSTISGNSATGGGYGGGVVNFIASLKVSNSTISGNFATNFGGGILNAYSSIATISNSTLSGNSTYGGGGIVNYGAATATISNSTLSGNSAGGGGIYNFQPGSTVTVKNSIVGNSLGGGDCSGLSAALGANLDTDGSCGSTNFTQVTSAQLNLGPLALNAPGTTKTLALLPGSVAIDSAPDCTDVSGSPVTTDQRGVARPDGLGEAACDIGAFEFADETLFASFTAKLSLDRSDGAFDLNSRFTLGATTNGIDPLVESVSLAIGSYSATFAPGSFKKNKKGVYVFDGAIHGVELNVRISPLGGNSYWFQARGEGAKLKGTKNPVTVTLTIGADLGSVVVHAKFED